MAFMTAATPASTRNSSRNPSATAISTTRTISGSVS